MATPHVKIFIVFSLLTTLYGCASGSGKSDYSKQYLNALNDFEGQAVQKNHVLQTFGQLFTDMKQAELQNAIESSYAEKLYFNDTLQTFTERQALIPYLLKTADELESITVSIQDIAFNDNDYYIRWFMEVQFKTMGKTVNSHSIGMTHLRFNSGKKIIVHQDFWDSGHGLYRHLPMLGFFVRQVQAKL